MKKLTIFLVVFSLIFSGMVVAGFAQETEKEVIKLKVLGGETSAPERADYFGLFEKASKESVEKLSPEVRNSFPVAKYEFKHPGVDIQIEGEAPPYGDMLKEIQLAVSSRASYDLIEMDDIWLGQIAESGYLSAKHSDQYEKWANDLGFYDVFKKGSKYKGKYYGLWKATDTRAIWVWKDVLHAAGYTMEDIRSAKGLLNALPEITKTAKEEFGMSGGLEYPFNGKWVVDQWYGWLYQLGGKILKQNEDGEWVAGFNNEAGYESLNYVKKLKEAGATMRRTWQWNLANFMDRSYAMTYEGSWDFLTIKNEFPNLSPAEIQEKIGMIPTTVFEGEEMRVLTGGWLWTIPKTANHPDLTFNILTEIFADRKAYAQHLAYEAKFPTSEKLWESSLYQEKMLENMPEEWFESFQNGVEGGVWRPFFPEYPKIQKALWDATQKVIMGKATAKEALTTAEKKVNNLMED